MEIKSLKDKIKSESPFSGIAIPILIVLLSVVLVAGITRMLTSDKGYITLVEELRDKTFGNRWVAAFELSKYLASSQIPVEDIPWLENQLFDIYQNSSNDPRTRNFLILAAGSLKGPKSLSLVSQALEDNSTDILFAAVTTLPKFEKFPTDFNWPRVLAIAEGKVVLDEALQHAALVVLTHFAKEEVIPQLKLNLESSQSKNLKDISAIALMHFNLWDGLERIKYLLELSYDKKPTENQQSSNQSLNIEANKLNIIQAAKILTERNISMPEQFLNLLIALEKNDSNIQVQTRAKEILLMLKK